MAKYTRILHTCSIALTAMGFTLMAANAVANPQGGVVTSGNTSISQSGTTTTINQSSQKTIINWNSFNINKGETTHFQQPTNGVALNRINPSQGASQIYGTLSATGNIILVNGAGIYFAPGSMVNVGGLIASTSGISNYNFKHGKYIFDRASRLGGSIINAGTIRTSDYGLVALLGTGVVNSGVIKANLGSIVLGAGSKFTLAFSGDQLVNFEVTKGTDRAGVDQNGKRLSSAISNTGKLLDAGQILVTAKVAANVLDNVINMRGVAQTKSVSTQGGEIILSAGTGKITVSGKLSVSNKGKKSKGGIIAILGKIVQLTSTAKLRAIGGAGGGNIYVGGNEHGAGPLLNAQTTTVAASAELNASALYSGNGGNVIVWSDDTTTFAGTILAKGGALSGNGGFSEVSGHRLLNFDGGYVNLTAPHGVEGSLLLDPENVTIQASGSSSDPINSGTFTPTVADSILTVTDLENALATSNVTVTTGTTGSQAGNITVNDPVSWSGSANSGTSLTLNAAGSIFLNANITATDSNSSINFQSPVLVGSNITLTAGNKINFTSTINDAVSGGGVNSLVLQSQGNTLAGNVGGTNPLINLTLSDASGGGSGSDTINASSITTTGDQTYNNALSFTASTVTMTAADVLFMNSSAWQTSSAMTMNLNLSGITSMLQASSATNLVSFNQNGGTLTLNLGTAQNENFTVNSGIFNISNNTINTLTLNGGELYDGGDAHVAGAFTVNGNNGSSIGVGGGNLYIDGNLTGSGTLTVNLGSTLHMEADNSATWTGTIIVDGGATFESDHNNSFGGTSATVEANSGAPIYLNAVGGSSEEAKLFVVSGITAQLYSENNSTYAGTISGDSSSTLSINPNSGTLTISGNSPVFAGNAYVTEHNVVFTNANAVGTAIINIEPSGTLNFTGNTTYTNNIVNGGTISVSGTQVITLSGNISDGTNPGNIFENGDPTGELILSGTNTYSGQTTANGGMLTINSTASAGTSTVMAANGGTIKLNFNGTLPNSINLDNGILKTGSSSNLVLGGTITVESGGGTINNEAPTPLGMTAIVADTGSNGSVTINSPNSVSTILPYIDLTDGGTGSLTVNSNGEIIQSDVLLVSGASNFNAGAHPITLTDVSASTYNPSVTGNNLSGVVNVSNTSTNDISIINNGNLTTGTVSAGQNIFLTTTAGNITVGSAITLSSANALYLNAAGNIAINSSIEGAGNTSVGTLVLSAQNAAQSITTSTNGAINVKDFSFLQGEWYQNGTLPQLTVSNNFSIASGSAFNNFNAQFLRVESGDGSTGTPFKIDDVFGLQGIATLTSAFNFVLTQDIDASGTANWNNTSGFDPITALNGVFNGALHSISNLVIALSTTINTGLFSQIASGAEVENLGMISPHITGSQKVGAIAGTNSGTVTGDYVSGGTIAAVTLYAGGLVGYNQGTISSSYNASTAVSALQGTGGLVGANLSTGTISLSYNASNLTVNSIYVGGIAGLNQGTIQNSYNTGNISDISNSTAAGIVGLHISGSIIASYNSGNISAGGDAGGLVGIMESGSISLSDNTGSVSTGNVGQVAGGTGGLVGNVISGTIANSYNTGAVSITLATDSIGGFVGTIASGSISTSYSAGTLTATNGSAGKGGFIGSNTGTASYTNDFFDSQVAGISNGIGTGTTSNQITGMNTANMKISTNYTGFDFTGTPPIWTFASNPTYNSGYPVLVATIPTLTISGTVVGGNNDTITLMLNNTLLGTVMTNGSGVYTASYTGLSAGGDIFAYLSAGGLGSAMTVASSNNISIAGFNLNLNSVDLGDSGFKSISNSDLISAGHTVNSLLSLFTYSGNNITLNTGVNFNTTANTTLNLNGNISASANIAINGATNVATAASIATTNGSIGMNLIDGAHALALSSTTGTTISDDVGAGTPLSSLTISGNGSIAGIVYGAATSVIAKNSGVLTLSNTANSFGGGTIANAGGTIGASVGGVFGSSAIVLATGGTLDLSNSASISNLISLTGNSVIDYLDTSNPTLNAGVIAATSSNASLTIVAPNGGVALPYVNLANGGSGSLSVTSNGAITQNDVLLVNGASSFNAGANAITLTDTSVSTVNPSVTGNNLAGAISVSNTGANDISITTSANMTTGDVNAGQNINFTSTGGNITTGSNIYLNSNNALTLNASNTIAINANIEGTGNTSLGNLFLNANSSTHLITATGAINVDGFYLAAGIWNQVGNLPAFTVASNFVVTNGPGDQFLRAAGGNGSVSSPYVIDDIYGLQGIATLPPYANNLAYNYILGNDIDASITHTWNSGSGFRSISYMLGIFNGNAHAISNLYINETGLFIGMIQELEQVQGFGTAEIKNLGLINPTVTGNGQIVGAFVGENAGGILLNDYVSGGSVSGVLGVGGLVGANVGTIISSYNNGTTITASNLYAGGLIGANETLAGVVPSVISSYSTGDVTAFGNAGGFIGVEFGGSVDQSYSTGAVTVTNSGGAGGFIGSLSTGGTITNSYSTGVVTAENSTIDIGGFAGDVAVASSISTSYSAGTLNTPNGAGNLGGFVGKDVDGTSSYTHNYFDSTQAATTTAVGSGATGADISAEITSAMKIVSTFVGFNFTVGAPPTWAFTTNTLTNNGYPVLTSLTPGPYSTYTPYVPPYNPGNNSYHSDTNLSGLFLNSSDVVNIINSPIQSKNNNSPSTYSFYYDQLLSLSMYIGDMLLGLVGDKAHVQPPKAKSAQHICGGATAMKVFRVPGLCY